jgi:hypothetical protein
MLHGDGNMPPLIPGELVGAYRASDAAGPASSTAAAAGDP